MLLAITGCGDVVEGSGASSQAPTTDATDGGGGDTATTDDDGTVTSAGPGSSSGASSTGDPTGATTVTTVTTDPSTEPTVDPSADPSATTVDTTDPEATTDGLSATSDDTTTGCDNPGTWYPDADMDGFGDEQSPTVACEQPPGHIDVAGDCDDDAASAHPGAPEICDQLDNDCDTYVDEGSPDNLMCGDCKFAIWNGAPDQYYVYCSSSVPWQQARERCQSFGGDLATLKSDPENDWVGAWSPEDAWIGLTDAEVEDSWKWVDGSSLDWSDWALLEPNDNGDEDCVIQLDNNFDTWNDVSCGSSRRLLCEQPF